MVPMPNLASPLAPEASEPVQTIAAAQFTFLAGTRVTTLRGETPVDELTTADRMRCRTGEYVPVRSVHRKRLAAAHVLAAPEDTVILRRNSLGEGLPRRDIALTGGHMIEGQLGRRVAHVGRLVPGLPGLNLDGSAEVVVFDCVGVASVRAEGLWVSAVMRTYVVEDDDAPASALIRMHA